MPDDDDDALVDLTRPPAGPLGRVRQWVEWFGPGRVLGGVVTAVVVVVGGWWLLRAPTPPTEAGLPLASPAAATATSSTLAAAPTTAPGPIVVHVAGAVAVPGVYELAPGARVHAAVEAAGGARADADPAGVNLAAPVTDGERVYVPAVGEEAPPLPASGDAPGSTALAEPIDLNRASANELDELPGIGPATAAAIVDHREANGPFAAVDDLEAVRGIGPAKLDAIRELVRV